MRIIYLDRIDTNAANTATHKKFVFNNKLNPKEEISTEGKPFLNDAKNGRSIISNHTTFLPGQERWPIISSWDPAYFVASREQIESALIIMNELIARKVKYRYFKTSDLEMALKIKSLPATDQEAAFTTERKKYKDNWQMAEMGAYAIVIAKYVGYDRNRIPTYEKQPIADFEILEILNSKSSFSNHYASINERKPIKVFYTLRETWNLDFRQDPNWKFNPSDMPKPGTTWILVLDYFHDGVYSTNRGAVGRFAYNPENVTKIKDSIENAKKEFK